MQEAFAEEGIEFANRKVTVYIPLHTDETESGEKQDEGATASGTSDKKLIEKAAAAIATAQADEDSNKNKSCRNSATYN